MKSLRIVVNRTEVRPHAGEAARELLPSEINEGRAQDWAVPSCVEVTLGPKLPKLCLAMVLSLNREGGLLHCDSTLEINDQGAPRAGGSRGFGGQAVHLVDSQHR